MDDRHARRQRRENQTNLRATLAVNARYTASLGTKGISIRDLTNERSQIYAIKHQAKKPHHDAVLAFHSTRLNLLAVSNGSQLVIFDVDAAKATHVFNGNGRTITSAAFDQSDGDTLATGTADGIVSIWSMKETSRPLHRLRASRSACSHVSLHRNRAGLIAALSGSQICIWRLPSSRAVASFKVRIASIHLFTWCPGSTARILTLSYGGVLSLYDLEAAVRVSSPRKGRATLPDSDQEDEIHHRANDPEHLPPQMTFNLACSVIQAEIFGQNGVVVLPGSHKDLYFYSYNLDQGTMTELWRLHKENNIHAFTLRRNMSAVDVVIVLENSTEAYRVPAPVLDSMGWSSELQSAFLSLGDEKASKSLVDTAAHGFMRPQKKIRRARGTPNQQGTKPRSKAVKESPAKARSRITNGEQLSRPSTPATQSMTSSLELPKDRHNEEDEDSPMPFLSPNIPARKVSPGLMTPMDESMQLPPLALYDPIAPAVDHAHESDSDDETFAGDMKGSGTLLPGGINVPLPRSCGALFGPNGQLITFFPYSIKKAVHESTLPSKGSTGVEKHGEEVNKLFPSFGNLLSTSQPRGSPSDSNRTSSEDLQSGNPVLAIQSSSLDDGPSWTVKTSPVKPKTLPLPGEHRVNVSIRNLEALTPTRQTLATTYELANDNGHSYSDVCHTNATLAAKDGLQASAGAWNLLAIILDSSLLDRQAAHGLGDISAILLGKRPAISRHTSMASSHDGFSRDLVSEIFSLLQLPFGRTWAVERLFKWAEDRADVQLLACMSTILKKTRDTLAATAKSYHRRRQTGSMRNSLSALPGLEQDSTTFPPTLPSLRTEDTAITTAGNSPNKGYRSRLSSGNPSQPTTPYVESSGSTPPFAFPNVTRHNSNTLNSGSASPEHHRSSFGLATKNYAASIIEKFNSYGSSPPSKRLGTSPGNELSSSLPNTTGSWSKSVSFASTMETAKTSHRSLSLAQEDDEYDSDRTVDDNSVLNTPKKPHGGVSVTKKKGSFYEEASSNTPTHPIPGQITIKCGFWREHYAEQLRSWDMLTDAAEMTDFPSAKALRSSINDEKDLQHVLPETASGRRFNDCSICSCVVHAAQQVCPACLHVTHPGCLEDLLTHVGPDDFTCPTGCGCDCLLAIEQPSIAEESAVIVEEMEHKQPFKKRHNSLTDPLRLRQRLQGESW